MPIIVEIRHVSKYGQYVRLFISLTRATVVLVAAIYRHKV